MKIELKNIKHVPTLSEETECFSAIIYIDGKKRGGAANRGTGGSTNINPRGLANELDAYAATLPNIEAHGITLKMDAELLIDQLLGDALQRQKLKKLCRTKTLFRLPSRIYADGEYEVINVKYGDVAIAWVRDKYGPSAQILNETLKEAP